LAQFVLSFFEKIVKTAKFRRTPILKKMTSLDRTVRYNQSRSVSGIICKFNDFLFFEQFCL